MTAPTHKLIAEAQREFPELRIRDTLDACEAFYMNGIYDEICGDVDTIGHYYRIDRFIVHTDSFGDRVLLTFDTVAEAEQEMESLSQLDFK